MTTKTAEEHVAETADLLQSLQASVRRLRQEAERLFAELDEKSEGDVAQGGRQLGNLEGLIRICQKVEASLVEQYNRQTGVARGGYALDLERARVEIGCRLARLRACCCETELP